MLSYLCLRMLDTLGRLNMKMLKIRFSHQLMVNAVVPLSKDVGYSRTFKHENAKDIFLSPADG